MAEKGTPAAAKEQHEFLTSREALRLAQLSQGTGRSGRQRRGLNGSDVDRAAAMVKIGKTWPEILAVFVDVHPDTMEAWRPQIEALAAHGPQPRKFDGPQVKSG